MRILAVLAAVALVAVPDPAAAQSCAALPAPLYVPGTTDVKPFLVRVAPKLATAAGDDQVTIVYQAMGSCTALDYVLTGAELTGTASYWDGEIDGGTGQPVEKSCLVPRGTRAGLALSDVSTATCTGAPPPRGIAEVSSMAQGFGFVVPEGAASRAITATEGYFLFKFGGEAGKEVAPWTDPALIAIRTPAASTQLLVGLAVGVLGTMWSANLTNVNAGSSDVIAKVAAEAGTGNADQALGILSLQRYDGARDELDMLAFESFDQACLGAVYPDATPTSFDKRNLRDGHYTIWGYLWAVAEGRGGAPSDPRAARFAAFLRGTAAINGADPIVDAARAGAVPDCAMTVRRAFDGARLERYRPAAPCGCAFEQAATGATTCTACSDETPCAAGVCRAGYCEAR